MNVEEIADNLSVTRPEAEPKAWQVNYLDDEGHESEMTFYSGTKGDAVAKACRIILKSGRLPHDPYRG